MTGRARSARTRIGLPYLVMILLGVLAIAALVARDSSVAFVIVAVPLLILAFNARPWVLIAVAAALPWVSRLLTTRDLIPRLFDFADFGLVVLALVVAVISHASSSRRLPPGSVWILRGIGLFAGAIVLSGVINGSPLDRLLAGLLLTLEPFLLLAAVLFANPGPRGRMALFAVIAVICAVQVPVAVAQSFTSTDPDVVKGTILEAGAGHHVMAGGLVVGLFAAIAWFKRWVFVLPIALAVLWVGVLADAKQVLFAAPVGFIFASILIGAKSSQGLSKLAGRTIVVVAGFVVVLVTLAPSDAAFDMIRKTRETGGGKPALTEALIGDLANDPLQGAFGFGPGETVSRFGYLTTLLESKDGKSPTESLGLAQGELTEHYDDVVQTSGYVGDSSFSSGQSSLLGVVGDYGFLGLLALGIILWRVMVVLVRSGSRLALSALATWGMAIPLGYIFDWLEQPPFMLLVALLTGLALTEHVTEERLPRTEPLAELASHQFRAHVGLLAVMVILAVAVGLLLHDGMEDRLVAIAPISVVDTVLPTSQNIDTDLEVVRPVSAARRARQIAAVAASGTYRESIGRLDEQGSHTMRVVVEEDDAIEVQVFGRDPLIGQLADEYATILLETWDRHIDALLVDQATSIDAKLLEASLLEEDPSLEAQEESFDRQLGLTLHRSELLSMAEAAKLSVFRDSAVYVAVDPSLAPWVIATIAAVLALVFTLAALVVRQIGSERVYETEDVHRVCPGALVLELPGRHLRWDDPAVQLLSVRLQHDNPDGRSNVVVETLGAVPDDIHLLVDVLSEGVHHRDHDLAVTVVASTGPESLLTASGVVIAVDIGGPTILELEQSVRQAGRAGVPVLGILLYGPGPIERITRSPEGELTWTA